MNKIVKIIILTLLIIFWISSVTIITVLGIYSKNYNYVVVAFSLFCSVLAAVSTWYTCKRVLKSFKEVNYDDVRED